MKHILGYGLMVAGIGDAIYMYSSGLTGQLEIFSGKFVLLLALFVCLNFFAVLVLSTPAKQVASRRSLAISHAIARDEVIR